MVASRRKGLEREMVGILPAGGKAFRLGRLPYSKELLPTGVVKETGPGKIQVISENLIDQMRAAGVKKIYVILRNGKWDIPAYFRSGNDFDVRFAYLILEHPFGVPFTVDTAKPFVKDAIVLFGFPDLFFDFKNAFQPVVERLQERNEDIVLGLMKVTPGNKADMVKVDQDGKVLEIYIKPDQTDLEYAWTIAAWTPVFTEFLSHWVNNHLPLYNRPDKQYPDHQELYMGNVIQNGMQQGLTAGSVMINHYFYDIGTPGGLSWVFQR